jgi:hypothetical protein
MSVYEPKTILLPSGLDEVGLDRSVIRLPGESLVEYKRRLLLEHRDPVSNSFNTFKKSPTRQVGQPEIAIARLTLNTELERPRLRITSSKLYWYSDANEAAVLELDLQHRDQAYFLDDVFNELTALNVFDIEILDDSYQYRFSRNLRIDDSDITDTRLLSENYVNRLDSNYVRDLTFTDSLVFKTERASASELTESGDFFVDTRNGVVFSLFYGGSQFVSLNLTIKILIY